MLMLTELYESIFGCLHRKTTWPQGPAGGQTVTCLSGCGQTFHYDWSAMKRGAPLNQNPRIGAVQSPILDKRIAK